MAFSTEVLISSDRFRGRTGNKTTSNLDEFKSYML